MEQSGEQLRDSGSTGISIFQETRDVDPMVVYHPLYSMNNFVTNKSKLPQDGVQVFLYMG